MRTALDQLVEQSRRLNLAAFRTSRFRRRRPAITIEMRPARSVADKAAQEQRRNDRAGEGAAGGERRDGGEVVTDKQHRTAAARDLRHPVQAARLEFRIADGQHFVNDQDLGIEMLTLDELKSRLLN